MPDEMHIQELIERAIDEGLSPEEVCAQTPELLTAVRERWQRVRELDAQLESMFPTPSHGSGSRARQLQAGPELPRIPGYTVESLIGSGGMGVVYKATHHKLRRTVAVKMLLAGAFASPRELACLLREAQAVAGLHHPGIVQVHDVGELDGLPYFTMEYIEGGTLAQRLAGAPQPPRQAAALVATIAGAVYAAHRGGVVHRDIKPSNILLDADGSPKLADFSLARSTEAESSVTLGNARLGTPSYMAPEQASGGMAAFQPDVDIYALGAVLYEALTGRPPFHAATPAETQRQALTEEPVPPSRLNSRVPRDLETVCLKCLRKDPRERYTTAAALEDDLKRFLAGEPVLARRPWLTERLAKWARRKPGRAVALGAAAVAVTAGGWLLLAIASHRAEITRSVEADLAEVARHEDAGAWEDARASLTRAKARLENPGWRGWGPGTDAHLSERLMRIDSDLALVARLDKIRLDRAAVIDGRLDLRANRAAANRAYAQAFKEAGIAPGEHEEPAAVAARITASPIHSQLVAAFDDWATCVGRSAEPEHQRWLLDVVRQADHDPTGWRDSVRDVKAWNNGDALAALADKLPAQERSLGLLTSMGVRLGQLGVDPVPFLQSVRRRFPSDFWANFSLGLALAGKDTTDAARYLQAAVVARPDLAVAYTDLGIALAQSGRIDEALQSLRDAVQLDPGLALSHENLGNVLALANRPDEAIAAYRRAIELDPTAASTYNNLGKIQLETGNPGEAERTLAKAIELSPSYWTARSNHGLVLRLLGRMDEALDECSQAAQGSPDDFSCRLNLGMVLRDLQRYDEAAVQLQQALRIEPMNPLAHCNLGEVLAGIGRTDDAEACYRQALVLNPRLAKAYHDLGMLAGDSHNFQEAERLFRKAVELDPGNSPAIGALGRAMMLQKKYADAKPYLQTFLDSMTPGDSRGVVIKNYISLCDEKIAEQAEVKP